jgi:hypothetical protein
MNGRLLPVRIFTKLAREYKTLSAAHIPYAHTPLTLHRPPYSTPLYPTKVLKDTACNTPHLLVV